MQSASVGVSWQQHQAMNAARPGKIPVGIAMESSYKALGSSNAARLPSSKIGQRERQNSTDDMRQMMRLVLTKKGASAKGAAESITMGFPAAKTSINRYLAKIRNDRTLVRRCDWSKK